MKEYKGVSPTIHPSVLICESADVVGDVIIGENSSVWYNAVLRGDMEGIVIGNHSNIQDGTVVHTHTGHPTTIGNFVTVGHNCILHGCTVGNGALIGMGAIVLDGAVIEDGALVAAGCVVPPGKVVPARHLAIGNPMVIKKELSAAAIDGNIINSKTYVELASEHKKIN